MFDSTSSLGLDTHNYHNYRACCHHPTPLEPPVLSSQLPRCRHRHRRQHHHQYLHRLHLQRPFVAATFPEKNPGGMCWFVPCSHLFPHNGNLQMIFVDVMIFNEIAFVYSMFLIWRQHVHTNARTQTNAKTRHSGQHRKLQEIQTLAIGRSTHVSQKHVWSPGPSWVDCYLLTQLTQVATPWLSFKWIHTILVHVILFGHLIL